MTPENVNQHLRFVIGFAALGYTHKQAVDYVAAMHPELLSEIPEQQEYNQVMQHVNKTLDKMAEEMKKERLKPR